MGTFNETVAVVSRIANSCVAQVIIVVSVNCQQRHKGSANSKEFLSETKHIFVFTWFSINQLIFNHF